MICPILAQAPSPGINIAQAPRGKSFLRLIPRINGPFLRTRAPAIATTQPQPDIHIRLVKLKVPTRGKVTHLKLRKLPGKSLRA